MAEPAGDRTREYCMMISPRAQVQVRLADHLAEHRRTWSAPYGILDSIETLPRGGKVRVVAFGVARTLDALAYIWSPTRIEVRASGQLAHAVEGTYDSLDALLARLAPLEGRP